MKRQFSVHIRILQGGKGTEFVNVQVQRTLEDLGIHFRASISYVHEENGRAERMNRTLVDHARSILKQAALGTYYWSYSLRTATYVYHRTIIMAIGLTPFEKLYDRVPNIAHLRTFGVHGFALRNVQTRTKWQDTATPIIFLDMQHMIVDIL